MRKTGIALLSAASLLAAGTAMAAEPQWNFVEAGWIQGDGFEDSGTLDSVTLDGFQLRGSLGFLNNFHAQ